MLEQVKKEYRDKEKKMKEELKLLNANHEEEIREIKTQLKIARESIVS